MTLKVLPGVGSMQLMRRCRTDTRWMLLHHTQELGGTNASQVTVCMEVFDGEAPLGCLQPRPEQTCCVSGYQRRSSPYAATLSMQMPPDAKLWSPESPFLYNATVTLYTGGKVDSNGTYLGGGIAIDTVISYFGHRTVSTGMVDGVPRVLLNEKPCVLTSCIHYTRSTVSISLLRD